MLAVASAPRAVTTTTTRRVAYEVCGSLVRSLARSVLLHRSPCPDRVAIPLVGPPGCPLGRRLPRRGRHPDLQPRLQRRRAGRQGRAGQRAADEEGLLDSLGPQALLRSPRLRGRSQTHRGVLPRSRISRRARALVRRQAERHAGQGRHHRSTSPRASRFASPAIELRGFDVLPRERAARRCARRCRCSRTGRSIASSRSRRASARSTCCATRAIRTPR